MTPQPSGDSAASSREIPPDRGLRRVGVLALQGDVREHLAVLRQLGAEPVAVRRPADLDGIDGIVLPGGESTTIGKLLVTFEVLEPLRKLLADGLPAYGSCAGMILLAERIIDGTPDQVTLGGIDVTVRRNAFGRQVDSFEGPVEWAGTGEWVHGVFIRAPWVEQIGDGVEVIATVPDGSPGAGSIVAVRQGALLATAFHPELTSDARVHRHFLDIVDEARTGMRDSARAEAHTEGQTEVPSFGRRRDSQPDPSGNRSTR